MIDEDTGPLLPLAIYLEDSKFSVNVTELCWVNKPQGMTGVSTHAYNPVSKLSLQVLLLYEEEEKRTESEPRKRWPTQHSTITAGTYGSTWSTSHSLTCFCPHNILRGWYHYLLRKMEQTKVHRDKILSPLLFLIILYCLPGENYSLMAKFSKSPQSIYMSYDSQSPTISQKVLQGDNHFKKMSSFPTAKLHL